MSHFAFQARLRRSPITRLLVNLKLVLSDLMKRLSGKNNHSSPIVKRRELLRLLRQRGLNQVVETGTFLGDTAHFLAARGNRVTTLEIDPELAALARERFKNQPSIAVVEGDSAKLLPTLVAKMPGPALYYLDGHYSGVGTGQGSSETPVQEEARAILAGAKSGSLVVIDDARCFGSHPGYPKLEDFLDDLRARGAREVAVEGDSIRFAIA